MSGECLISAARSPWCARYQGDWEREKRQADDSMVCRYRMIYSSITPQVHIFRTAEHEDEHQLLDFSARSDNSRFSSYWGAGHFGVSSKFPALQTG